MEANTPFSSPIILAELQEVKNVIDRKVAKNKKNLLKRIYFKLKV